MTTLWDLASQSLKFASRNSEWERHNAQSTVREPGSRILEVPDDWMADRCIHDPNLLGALEESVQQAFTPIQATDRLSRLLGFLRESYEGSRTSLLGKTNVARFLGCGWLAMAELLLCHFLEAKGLDGEFHIDCSHSSQRRQPTFYPRLIYQDGTEIDVGLIEVETEGIMRGCWGDVVDRGKRNVKVDWLGAARWDTVDKIIVKVATYMAYYRSSWLCWTAASHLLVFRLIRKPGTNQRPFLVVSKVAQVNDIREPLENLADARIGELWMPAILGCALAGIAARSDSQFQFHVADGTMVSGSPTPTPREEEERFSSRSSLSSEISKISSDNSWNLGGFGHTRAPDLFVFSSASGLQGLAAPLIAGIPSRDRSGDQRFTNDSRNEDLPFGLWEKRILMCSLFPKLEIGRKLGEGSTGIVYEGLWDNVKVAVKMAEGVDERERLERESGWYSWLLQQGAGKVVLPTFFGWYRHSFFDLLIMSHEGDPVVSWDDLRLDERYALFSVVCELHRVGLRHGDIEPRNVLRSKTGNLCLIDLSEASKHRCHVSRKKRAPLSDGRLPPDVGLCWELKDLCIALGIIGLKRPN